MVKPYWWTLQERSDQEFFVAEFPLFTFYGIENEWIKSEGHFDYFRISR